MIGLPGGGKSTYSARLARDSAALHLHPDSIRLGLDPKEALEVLWVTVSGALRLRLSVIVDVCALRPHERERWLILGREHGAKCRAVLIDTPLALCRERDAARSHPIPASYNWSEAAARVDTVAGSMGGWDSFERIQ